MRDLIDLRRILTETRPSATAIALRILLRCLSLPYALAMVVRNKLYEFGIKRSYRSPLIVVSVGNLSVGGTGKSPAVAWLAKWFRRQGIRVAILSRGYGALDSGQNDEALELELQLPDVPHLQHVDRVASAIVAEAELDMQVLILDDGFQHRRIQRDLDIVLLDATDARAIRWCLPGGVLREPMGSLARAGVVMLTRCDQIDSADLEDQLGQIRRLAADAILVHARHRPCSLLCYPNQQKPVDELRGLRVLAFCAIGNPGSFFATLRQLGAEILETRVWPDHHGFDATDVQALHNWVAENSQAQVIVCTVKDWVKLEVSRLGDVELWALAVEMDLVQGTAELEESLQNLLAKLPDNQAGSSAR
ncbi:MAG: tetraacyldisaccharide 4'-kinase [Planctomycetales bacterium]|nr:tetraacyldisaccharide 4'-kinase [Planctomycetales bacterium]